MTGIARTGHEARADAATECFVGRAVELSQFHKAAQDARSGSPSIILVEGEPAIGKTYLISQALSELPDFAPLVAYGDRTERELPYGILAQLLRRVPATILREFPALTGHIPDNLPPSQLGAQFLALLGKLQDGGPVAIVVDDIQWADGASVQALGFVRRRLWADRVLTVLAARVGGPDEADPIGEEWQRVSPGRGRLTRLRLRGLSNADVRLLAERTGLGSLSPDVARRLRDHTDGHPLYVRMLLADLDIGGVARRFDAVLPVPDLVARTVRARLGTLSPDSRALLEALAVLDARCPLRIVGQVAGVARPSAALEPLLHQGLVAWWPGDPSTPIQARHPLLQAAVYGQLFPVRRRQLHAAAVPVVDQHAALRHRVAATEHTDPELATELEITARQRLTVGATADAVTYLLWAADLTAGRAEYERLVLAAATELLLAEQFARARSVRAAVEACAASTLRECLLGLYLIMDGSLVAAEEQLDAIMTSCRDDPSRAWEATLAGHWLSSLYCWRGEGPRTLETVQVPLRSGLLDGHREHFIYLACVGRAFTDGHRAALHELDRLCALPDADEVGSDRSYVLAWRGAFRIGTGQLRAALRDLRAAQRLAASGVSSEVPRTAHFFLAQAQELLGDWKEAAINADLAIATGEVDENVWAHAAANGMAARLAALRGDWAAADEYLDASRHWFTLVGPPQYAVYPALAAATIAQAHDDPAGILHALRPILDLPAEGWPRLYGHLWLPLLAEALIGTGRFEQAEQALDRLRAAFPAVGHVAQAVDWLGAWLAHQRGDLPTAHGLYLDALARPASPDDAPLHQAHLERGLGLLLRAKGERRAAIESLRRAADRYQTLGAWPFLDRCMADLSSCGLTFTTPTAGSPRGLTKRERAIAHLVLSGSTNSEVSRELYISVKTVEYHLGNIYAKLGISSRRQLASVLRGPASTHVPVAVES